MFNEEFNRRVLLQLSRGSSSINKLENSKGYTREFIYSGATNNVIEVRHYCSDKRIAPVIETIEYENPAVEGSRVTKITIS